MPYASSAPKCTLAACKFICVGRVMLYQYWPLPCSCRSIESVTRAVRARLQPRGRGSAADSDGRAGRNDGGG